MLVVKVTVVVVLLVAVTNCPALLVPTAWLPKVNEVGDRLKPAAEFTVSVAALLATLPAELLTTTVNCTPLSELVVAGVV
jgi:hypothetical protein